jgi:hypothetical protein
MAVALPDSHRVKKYGLTMMGAYAAEKAVGTTVNEYSDCR